MRVFLAGASGVIGVRLVALLVAEGHVVAGMTRSPDKAGRVAELGAEPVVCDVYDADSLTEAVVAFEPDLVMHQLTDLPDQLAQIPDYAARTTESAPRARATYWPPRAPPELGGVVIRYGTFYGPGTYGGDRVPAPPRIHVDEAARRTVELLDGEPGVVEIVEDVPQPSVDTP